MALEAFYDDVDAEIQAILATDFNIVISETNYVPAVDDSAITHPNLVTGEQRCKLIETCILHVDIRKSTALNFSHQRATLSKLYTAFVRSMARCAGRYKGKIRNIIGDRVMVVFDRDNCFANAVNTAILMNSVAKYMLSKHFTKNEIKCGIGLDYGKMLVTKTGIVKYGEDNTSHKALVWLGRPANVASKLADIANKTTTQTEPTIHEGFYFDAIDQWAWVPVSPIEFISKLERTFSPQVRHTDPHFSSFFQSTRTTTTTTQPILMTQHLFDSYARANPKAESVVNKWWSRQDVSVDGYTGAIYGGDVIFTDIKTRGGV
jgi:adenylate cyclase